MTVRRGALIRSFAVAAVIAGSVAPGIPAAAAACPAEKPAVQVGDTGGLALEGAVVDERGRLYVTDIGTGSLTRIDAPGAPAVRVARLPGGNGGGALALLPDGDLLVGAGADARVLLGDLLRAGTIWRFDPDTGSLRQLYSGFSAANGMALAKDGTIYATNDFATLIGRVSPAGKVKADWGSLASANGAVLSKDDKYLYVSRTFVNPGVSRIPVDNPRRPESLLDFTGLEGLTASPDGLTLDSRDRPVVPSHGRSDVFRIESPGVICRLTSNLPSSSVLVYGRGTTGFAQGHLYRAGFDGKIYEIPAGYDPDAVGR